MKKIKLLELKNSSLLSPEKFELIVGELLNFSKEDLFLNIDKIEITQNQAKQLNLIEKLIIEGTPPQYIFKKAHFFGNEFYVDENVLIPRPETELLVEKAVKFLAALDRPAKIIDIGTGSGCIAITLKKLFKESSVTACDISVEALKIAKVNSASHKAEIKFIKSDLFKDIAGEFDLICANLPYIDPSDPDIKKVADPLVALDGGKDGFELIEKLISDLQKQLTNQGLAILELGSGHAKLVRKSAIKHGLKSEITKDLSDFVRFALITK